MQRVPTLLSWLQVDVDERPDHGRFILTGSQHFGLSAAISQSLAGRTAVLSLLPPSLAELRRFDQTNTFKAWLSVLETGYLVTLIPAWHRNYNPAAERRCVDSVCGQVARQVSV